MSQVRPEGANGQAPPIDASLPFYPVRKVEARVNRSHQVRGLCIENPALKAGTKCNLIDKNLVYGSKFECSDGFTAYFETNAWYILVVGTYLIN